MELWLQGKKQRDTILEAKLADENRGKDGYRLENLLLSDYRTDSWKVDTEAYGINSSLWPPDLRNERCSIEWRNGNNAGDWFQLSGWDQYYTGATKHR
jgi:hypothetical protein